MLTSKDKRIVDLLEKEKLDKADCVLKSCSGGKNGESVDRASGMFEEVCYIYDHIMGILSDDEGESDGKLEG